MVITPSGLLVDKPPASNAIAVGVRLTTGSELIDSDLKLAPVVVVSSAAGDSPVTITVSVATVTAMAASARAVPPRGTSAVWVTFSMPSSENTTVYLPGGSPRMR